MAELYVRESYIHQRLQFAREHRHGTEEVVSVLHCHIQYFADVLVLVLNLKCFAVIALALTHIARHIDVRQKVHFYFDYAVPLAGFASTAFDVKTETPGFVAACSCLWRLRKQFAHGCEQAGVGSGI